MSKANRPTDHPAVSPYYIVPDGEQFATFLQTVFDAKEKAIHRNDDGSIMHGEFYIDDSVIMFGQGSKEWPAETCGVFIYVEDTDATYKRALDAGCESRQAPDDKDYGRAAGVRDPFGNTWWITSVK